MARRNRVPLDKTLKKVELTLKKIGAFLDKWEESEKPGQMLPQIERLRAFRDELLEWKRQASKSKTEAGRERLVREFVLICRTYS